MVKKIVAFMLAAAFFTAFLPAGNADAAALHPSKAYTAGQEAMTAGNYQAAVEYFKMAADQNPTAANYRALAEAYKASGQYEEAASAYREAAKIYEDKGVKDDAEIWKREADKLITEISLYAYLPGEASGGLDTGQKFEPAYGAYIGAYVDADPNLSSASGYVQTNFEEFNRRFGRHSVYFTYIYYGQPFPGHWVKKVQEAGAIPQLAMEPDGLNQVQNDGYLRQFAKDAASMGGPIFLRFASEMNGDWTTYYGDPQKYIEKFRLVHDVMAELAPNVVMVWTPNAVPEKNIDDYYPGDDYVDWVGVNFYAVAYHNMNPDDPAFDEDPTVFLNHVYDTYAGRKPMQISEWAATHKTTITAKELSDFAVKRIQEIYSALPRRYPRIKMVNWFDSDNLTNPQVPQERKINNYSLTDNQKVGEAYRQAIAHDYFLKGAAAERPKGHYTLFPDDYRLQEEVELSAFVKTYDPDFQVSYSVDGQALQTTSEAPYPVILSPRGLGDGWHTIELAVLDSQGKAAKKITRRLLVGEAPPSREIKLILGSNKAFIDNREVTMAAPALQSNNTTLVPLRFIGDALGAKVIWEGTTQTVTFRLPGKEVLLTIEAGEAQVNGKILSLAQPARLINDHTMVPLRFVSEALGADVIWNGEKQEITIIK